ncbi:DUF2169 family type VI secretion system accessory protein [Polyangium aurulentum]|uniref:DUF2169 family type VI secretion system accessory protein n=1 Tax=Polyangium aurulentum TaxID=2567896 RepID=UPI0010AEC146|nr:DUF2169 domain-containing protein [Polyangium aurulentum]UQA57128.1 DUF2169 domain-containing protein [Polyangium aurulentum]
MDIVSLCPLRAGCFAWQAHTGAHALTIIVKATFLLRPGESVLAPEQEPITEKERTWEDDPGRSVRVPSDRAPYKPRAEVMLVGHAYAPHRQPVRSLVARMTVGEMEKSIEVWCDRGIRVNDGQLLEGPRFVSMPLAWERSAGGPGTDNPIGMRFDAAPNRYGMVAIPNLQPLGTSVSRKSDTFAPVGFGPIGPQWPGRAQKLGRSRAEFRDPGWEKSLLPADFDVSYFQAAPPDQQIAQIRPDERIALENLHPEHARFVTKLPRVRPRAIADRAMGEREEVALVADTLWIDTDRGLCCVVWRGRIGLRHGTEAGRIAVWVEGMPTVAPTAEPSGGVISSEDEDMAELGATTLIGPITTSGKPALPFVPGIATIPETHQQIAADIARWVARVDGDGSGTIPPMADPTKKALPFGPEAEDQAYLAETIPPIPKAGAAATPFMPVVPPLPPMRIEGWSTFDEPVIGYMDPTTEKSLQSKADAVERATAEVAAPPMIGPLATPEMARAPAKPSPPKSEPATPPTEPTPSKTAEPPVDLTLEETATIAAELAEGKTERAKILDAHGVGEGAWKANETRWKKALEEEQGRGKSTLRGTYDTAYVARVEKFRGPILLEEYARIIVGLERGRANGVLDVLKIQQPALMPIVRVWTKKAAKDTKLGEESKKALREAKRA